MAGSKDTHSRGGDAPLSGAFGEVQKLRVRVAGAPEQACAGAAHPAPSGWHLRMLHADWQIDGLQQEHRPRNLPSAPSPGAFSPQRPVVKQQTLAAKAIQPSRSEDSVSLDY